MIPANIINIAQRNAQLLKCTVLIYKFRSTYVLLPVGFEIPEKAEMIGYMTRDLVFVEREVENTNQE